MFDSYLLLAHNYEQRLMRHDIILCNYASSSLGIAVGSVAESITALEGLAETTPSWWPRLTSFVLHPFSTAVLAYAQTIRSLGLNVSKQGKIWIPTLIIVAPHMRGQHCSEDFIFASSPCVCLVYSPKSCPLESLHFPWVWIGEWIVCVWPAMDLRLVQGVLDAAC